MRCSCGLSDKALHCAADRQGQHLLHADLHALAVLCKAARDLACKLQERAYPEDIYLQSGRVRGSCRQA